MKLKRIQKTRVCKMCGYEKTGSGPGSLSAHIIKVHGISCEKYFDDHIRTSDEEGKCKTCGNPTPFRNMVYLEFCCRSCASSYKLKQQWSDPIFRDKVSKNSSDKLKKQWEDPIGREKLISGAKNTWADSGYREKMSNVLKDRWSDPEYYSMMVDISKNLWKDPEYYNKVSLGVSDGLKKKWKEDQEYRDRMISVFKERWKDPEYKGIMSDLWKDPAHIEKMSKVFEEQLTKRMSKGEMELFEFININYSNTVSNKIMFLSGNIFIPDITVGNKIIEYNGNYWHGSKEAVDNDQMRYQLFKDNGYDVLIVWESEWYMNQEETKQRVIDFLNNEI